jgi:hypothetical protein
MRFFSAPEAVASAIRSQVMQSLGQPNGQASEPWREGGDLIVGGWVYLALGPHHTQGEFWEPMISAALESGVQEITQAEYLAARPQPVGN